jgi:transcriptional regulator with XRE-family HTH domain
VVGDSGIHFGRFVRAGREKKGLSLREFGNMIGRTESRMWQVERMEEPRMHLAAVGKIAGALGYSNIEDFDRAWRSTPVPIPRARRRSPSRHPKFSPEALSLFQAAGVKFNISDPSALLIHVVSVALPGLERAAKAAAFVPRGSEEEGDESDAIAADQTRERPATPTPTTAAAPALRPPASRRGGGRK